MKSVLSFFTFVLFIGFTSLSTAQTDWTKYPDNPVFTPGSSGEWDDYSLWQDTMEQLLVSVMPHHRME
jgi:hypothetical protein